MVIDGGRVGVFWEFLGSWDSQKNWDFLGIFLDFSWDFFGIPENLGFFWDFFGIFLGSQKIWDFFGIFWEFFTFAGIF